MNPETESEIRVVVCDDVAEMRSLLRYALETDPRMHVIGEAADGRRGTEMIAELQPDAVLLDLSMPEMDGLETIPEISSSAPDTAIIVFSGFAADRMSGPALDRGADRYIEKGAPLDDVISAVLEVVDARRGDDPDDPGSSSGPSRRPDQGLRGAWRAWTRRVGLAFPARVAVAPVS